MQILVCVVRKYLLDEYIWRLYHPPATSVHHQCIREADNGRLPGNPYPVYSEETT